MNDYDRILLNRGLIFEYILRSSASLDDRAKILSALSSRLPSPSQSKDIVDTITDFCSKHNAFPSYEYMVTAAGFPFKLPDTPSNLQYEDVQDLVEQEIEAVQKQVIAEKVSQTLAKAQEYPLKEFLDNIDSALAVPVSSQIYVSPPPVMSVYESMKGQSLGCATGIKQVDSLLIGLEPGNILTTAGFVGSFKTTFAVNFAYTNALLGYSTAFLTLEVPRDYIRFMLLARHSFNPKFATHGEPISHEAFRKRTLDDKAIQFAKMVEDDLVNNPNHGRIYVLELFDFSDLSFEGLRSFLSTLPKVDAFAVDYIQLFQYYQDKSIRLDKTTSMIDHFMRQMQMLCQNFYGKRLCGLVMSQTNRDGYKRASENNGKYDILALSESRELERSSFAVMFLYTDDTLKQTNELKISLAKNRGGRVLPDPVIIRCDPRYAVMGDALANYEEGNSFDFSSFLSPFNMKGS